LPAKILSITLSSFSPQDGGAGNAFRQARVFLISPFASDHAVHGFENDLNIGPERKVENIPIIETDPLFVIVDIGALADLPGAGNPGLHRTVPAGTFPVKTV
jgi:hypothetical protein